MSEITHAVDSARGHIVRARNALKRAATPEERSSALQDYGMASEEMRIACEARREARVDHRKTGGKSKADRIGDLLATALDDIDRASELLLMGVELIKGDEDLAEWCCEASDWAASHCESARRLEMEKK